MGFYRGWAAEQGSRGAGKGLIPLLRYLLTRQQADEQGHGLLFDTSQTQLLLMITMAGRRKKNGGCTERQEGKRGGRPDSNAVSGKMQGKKGMLKRGCQKAEGLWEDTEVISEKER